MTEYRKAKPEEREACIEFANYVFSQSSRPHDFEKLLPKVYGEERDSASFHHIAVDEKGRVRGLVAAMPETLRVAGHTLKAAYVGTVSVHPKARGEGHMQRLMQNCLEEMRGNCHISVLGGQRQRYEYFGYTSGGLQYMYSLHAANIRHALKDVDAQGVSFAPLFSLRGAEDFAYALNIARPAYAHREKTDMRLIFASFEENALGILENGALIGYLSRNNAGDNVSEIALSRAADMPKALKAYQEYTGLRKILFTLPEYEVDMQRCLGGLAESCSITQSAMYNILDFPAVLEAYMQLRAQTGPLDSGIFSAVLDGQPVTITVEDGQVDMRREAFPQAPVLDKMQAQNLLLTFQGRFMDIPAPAGWFPLPLFWHAIDTF